LSIDAGFHMIHSGHMAESPSRLNRSKLTRRTVLGGLLASTAGLAIGRAGVASAAGTATTTTGAAAVGVGYDNYSLLLNGQRIFVWSGEFHPFRLPSPYLWPDILQKMKASGFNAVCAYFNWSYHSPAPGVYDFTGVRDMDLFLDMAAEAGIYVIARPGPYVNGELNAGGFPGWLTTVPGRARFDSPGYLAAVDEWYSAVNAILARHQVTDGNGTVLLYQVENEYASFVTSADGQNYMAHLVAKARQDGITVPVYHNDKGRNGDWVPGSFPGSETNYLYAFDGYPSATGTPPDWGFFGSGGPKGGATASPDTPGFEAEFGGGWFDPWGGAPWNGAGYGFERDLDGPAYERRFYLTNIANGIKIHNIYMVFGGTSWGWLPAPVVYTSYDYGAAISEPRQLTGKIGPLKQIGYFLAAVPDVAKLDPAAAPAVSNTALKAYHMANPDTGTELYLIRNDHTTSQPTTFPLGAYTVPQSGPLTVAARDAKLILANYTLGDAALVYTTSHLMTHARDLAVLTGPNGDTGETVLNYPERPGVTGATSSYDQATGDLLIGYAHDGLAAVTVTPATGGPLTLLIADDDTAATIWRYDVPAGHGSPGGAVIVAGPALLRTAEIRGRVLFLTGDTSGPTAIQIWAPTVTREVMWNGRLTRVTAGSAGALAGRLDGPPPVALPAVGGWRYRDENPEADPAFDDSGWTQANATTSGSITPVPAGQPVLFVDDYGFHYGDVWYRGTWAGSAVTQLSLGYQGGTVGCLQAWLDGGYLGFSQLPTPASAQSTTGLWSATATFDVPAASQSAGEHVLAVLVRTMSHQEDGGANDAFKAGLGLTEVAFSSADAPPAVQWKIQGGDPLADQRRGPLNNGGLFGEREGWYLPEFGDAHWASVTLPNTSGHAGVAWYRTRFRLNIPDGVDASIGLTITDDPSRQYRALIFLNGWNVGQYINDVGPQTTFALPNGVLDTRGFNTLALAVTGASGCDLGAVTLVDLGTVAGGPTSAPASAPGPGPV
jgi:beta-galactosidase GanA